MATLYQQVLVAIDLGEEARHILERARQISERVSGELSILHVTEPGTLYAEVMGMDLSQVQQELYTRSQQRLAELGAQFGIPAERLHLRSGRPATQILQFCKEQEVGLLVMGSHDQRHLSLLGSNANAVLHKACCDVLAIRMPEPGPATPAAS